MPEENMEKFTDNEKLNDERDIEALIRGLEYKELTSQYSFHTEKSLKYLKFTEG